MNKRDLEDYRIVERASPNDPNTDDRNVYQIQKRCKVEKRNYYEWRDIDELATVDIEVAKRWIYAQCECKEVKKEKVVWSGKTAYPSSTIKNLDFPKNRI